MSKDISNKTFIVGVIICAAIVAYGIIYYPSNYNVSKHGSLMFEGYQGKCYYERDNSIDIKCYDNNDNYVCGYDYSFKTSVYWCGK